MRLGIIGPYTTTKVVKDVVERDIPDIQLVCECIEFFEQSYEFAAKMQNEGQVDAILFTGPTNYSHAVRRVTPTIPWAHLPHSRTSALQAFLTAQSLYGSGLNSISIDRYDADLLRTTLETCGIRNPTILKAPFDPEEPGFEHKLMEFHRDCFLNKGVSVCFTSMEHIWGPLLGESIPCVRILPAEEVIREQIYHLQLRCSAAQERRGRMAVIGIHFDYVFDNEKNLPIREWEKIQYQNKFAERIQSLAQKMEAAAFNMGMGFFFIATSRNMLMNFFLKNGEYNNLLQFGRQGPGCYVRLGIGVGNTMLEAYSRANMALNQGDINRSSHSYMVEDETGELKKLNETEFPASSTSADYFAHRIGVSIETLSKLCQVLESGDTLTAQELGDRMGLTVRSANRIITLLEEASCASLVGKASTGKGRPARIMKITLPASLMSSKSHAYHTGNEINTQRIL